jgi:glycosyltransferase involved in cell wall biosynthesis
MTEVLLITPVVPDPAGEGRAKRAHQWLTTLASDAKVSVIVVRGAATGPESSSAAPEDGNGAALREVVVASPRWRRALRALCAFLPRPADRLGKPLEWVSCRRSVRRELEAWRASAGAVGFERIFCFRLYLAEIAAAVALIQKRRAGVSPVIELDLDDIESETNHELAALAFRAGDPVRAALFAASGRAYRRAEARWLPRFDRVAVCCAEDQASIERRFAPLRARIVPNRLFAPLPLPSDARPGEPSKEPRVLFVGTLAYLPNSHAALWFASQVLPLLRQLDGRWTFVIAGFAARDDLRQRVRRLSGVELISPASRLEECYRRNPIVVAPLRAGGGTKIKVIEALAHGCAVVATEKAVRGLGIADGVHYWAAQSAEEFAAACRALAAAPARAAAMGERGRSHVRDNFTYGAPSFGALLPSP